MGQVPVTIAGRTYRVTCDDGQESRVLELGNYLDRRASELISLVGHVSEPLLLALVCLVVVDELLECRCYLEGVQLERNQLTQMLAETQQEIDETRLITCHCDKDSTFANATTEDEMLTRIERLAEKIELLANRLE